MPTIRPPTPPRAVPIAIPIGPPSAPTVAPRLAPVIPLSRILLVFSSLTKAPTAAVAAVPIIAAYKPVLATAAPRAAHFPAPPGPGPGPLGFGGPMKSGLRAPGPPPAPRLPSQALPPASAPLPTPNATRAASAD
ncbi:hypothetical protein D3C85_1440520 [compost metagenome]